MSITSQQAANIQIPPALSEPDISSTQSLLDSLYSFGHGDTDNKKLAKLLRHTDHVVASGSTSEEGNDNKGHSITSWKMQDHVYKRDPCPYPTRARGLFTLGTKRIVARAYDKFFNVDEVSWTKVRCLILGFSCRDEVPIKHFFSGIIFLTLPLPHTT